MPNTLSSLPDLDSKEEMSNLESDMDVLLGKVPTNGDPIGNVTMINQLGWDQDRYFRARNELRDQGKLQTGRGRGGSIKLPAATVVPVEPIETEEEKARDDLEQQLYQGCHAYIETWAKAQDFEHYLIETVANKRTRSTQLAGGWSVPDIVVVGLRKFFYWPQRVLEVLTFEVKPAKAAMNIKGVFEASSHSRFATGSYLALQKSENYWDEDIEIRIRSECQRLNVGLITFENSGQIDSFSVETDPRLDYGSPEHIDALITELIDEVNQKKILKWLR